MSPRKAEPLTIEYVLLGLIRSNPTHGYELLHTLEAADGIGLVWRIKPGRLYALLERLEGLGWLVSEVKPGDGFMQRKEYHIAPAGELALSAWMDEPVRSAHRMRQEFLARLYFAQQQGPEMVNWLVSRQEQTCRGWLESLKQESDNLPADAGFAHMVSRFRIGQVEAMLRWLDGCRLPAPG